MTREKMMGAISDLLQSLNYTLYTGVEKRINDTVKIMPAGWLAPPRLVKIEGQNSGTVTYAVCIHLMTAGRQLSSEQKLASWSRLEQDAITLFNALSLHANVIAASDLQCEPAEFSLSNHGELSIAMKFNLQIRFCS